MNRCDLTKKIALRLDSKGIRVLNLVDKSWYLVLNTIEWHNHVSIPFNALSISTTSDSNAWSKFHNYYNTKFPLKNSSITDQHAFNCVFWVHILKEDVGHIEPKIDFSTLRPEG